MSDQFKMTGFALNLDLTLYFDDLRKFSSVYVNLSKCKEVGDVEKHIKSIFKLEDNICLTNKRFLIPSCEDIQILQQYETLKVQKCDFFDNQIHRNKRPNPPCDQAALNLIQSERTIDLSCRPKQRLKINICQNHFISGTTLTPFVERGKVQNTPRPSTSSSSNVDEAIVCQLQHEKYKSKKKRHDDHKDDEEGVDILDMSVNKSAEQNNDQVNDNQSIKLAKVFDKSKVQSEVLQESTLGERNEKKSKKRKKHSETIEDIDLSSSCWDNLVSGNTSVITENVKKHKKKSKKCHGEENEMVTDLSVNTGQEDESTSFHPTMDEDGSIKKKHRKSRKCFELSLSPRENHDSLNYSNNNIKCSNREHSLAGKETETLETELSEGKKVSKRVDLLEEYRRIAQDRIDKFIDQVNKSDLHISTSTPTEKLSNSFLYSLDVESSGRKEHSIKELQDYKKDNECKSSTNVVSKLSNSLQSEDVLHSTDIIKRENTNESSTNNTDQGYTEEQCSNHDLTESKVRRIRIRKHSKKKKREARSYMSAVGPILNELVSKVHTKPVSSEAKHIFFEDKPFSKEVKIPPPSPVREQMNVQGAIVNGVETHIRSPAEASSSQGDTGINSETWQKQLLKLATTGSKPVVFHRSTVTAASKTDISTEPSHTLDNSTPDMDHPKYHSTSTTSDITSKIIENSNSVSQDYKKCNGETKAVNSVAPQPVRPEIITTNVQNIILTKYPIIDKVVAEDLILFKVLKLNENNQPGVSKTILAKVNRLTDFPEKILLQIMDGCEECESCNKIVENSEGFIIELRWSDILEPRLFYP